MKTIDEITIVTAAMKVAMNQIFAAEKMNEAEKMAAIGALWLDVSLENFNSISDEREDAVTFAEYMAERFMQNYDAREKEKESKN